MTNKAQKPITRSFTQDGFDKAGKLKPAKQVSTVRTGVCSGLQKATSLRPSSGSSDKNKK